MISDETITIRCGTSFCILQNESRRSQHRFRNECQRKILESAANLCAHFSNTENIHSPRRDVGISEDNLYVVLQGWVLVVLA